ncbi:MAG TPA: DUF4038 domain-containing protein [Methylomirabilota bacterium]|nr:DUF4038 domain-containing protein [Methylomirabilota bacterium]
MNVKLIRFSLAVLLVCAAARTMAADPVVAKWARFEQTFESSVKYANPLQDAALTVIFMSPQNETNKVHGFWDGGNTWRVRFAPNIPGKWAWATICSDTQNKGLHLQSGSFVCTAPAGQGRFEQHGPVRVSRDGFSFEHDDATPFFWLADTAWNGALLSTLPDWNSYLQTRAAQKFSAVQWVATQWRAAPDGDAKGEVAFTGKEKISVNPEFFRRLDAKADAVNRAGLLNVPVLLWAIGGHSADKNPGAFLPEDQAILLARYMVARWQGNAVAWMLGGDGHYFGSEGEKWRRIGRAVFNDIAHAPVTMHPKGRHWVWSEFKDEKWIGFIGYQSGHGDSDEALSWLTRGPLTQDWEKTPHHPLINLEPPYEGHLAYESKTPFSANLVRRTMYWSLLNGPTAGVSYGAHGVWGWDDGTKPPTDHPNTGTPLPWKKALTMPGAEQMPHMVSFFTSIDFHQLRPLPGAVVNNPGNQAPRKYIAAARSVKGDLTVVYVPEERTVEILLASLPPSPDVKWFNPRTGEPSAAVAVITDTTAQFPTPGEGDWILWMHTQVKK